MTRTVLGSRLRLEELLLKLGTDILIEVVDCLASKLLILRIEVLIRLTCRDLPRMLEMKRLGLCVWECCRKIAHVHIPKARLCALWEGMLRVLTNVHVLTLA